MPADYALLPIGQQMLLDLRDHDGAGRGVVESLGEFFPQATDFEWLNNPDSKTFLDAFYSEDGDVGWFNAEEYNEFWGYVADYSDHLEQKEDISETPSETAAGGFDFSKLAGWMNSVLQRWQTAASQPAAWPQEESAVRFTAISLVEGYATLWQGFDTTDSVWKYVDSAETPNDQTTGWTLSSQVDSSTTTSELESVPKQVMKQPEVLPMTAEAVELSEEDLARLLEELEAGDSEFKFTD